MMHSRTQTILRLFTVFLIAGGTGSSLVQAEDSGSRYYKGNTHTHSLWSDGNDFPEMIVDWYKERGYDFLALSDHNILSRGERWMSNAAIKRRKRTIGHAPLKKYLDRFGDDWVETRGEADKLEVRLRPIEEFRTKFEEKEKFLLLEAEEITDRFGKQEVHINAVNLSQLIKPQHGKSAREVMRNNLRAVLAEEKRSGKPVIAHLNHPNFRWSLRAEDLAHVVEDKFFEVYNGHPGINHLGREGTPGDEKIWDIASTIRLVELNSEPLYGVASDDAHNYHGGSAPPGRGWIMVRSKSLEADSLILAMKAGDFYASSGVSLKSIQFGENAEKKQQLTVEVDPESEGSATSAAKGEKEEFVIEFIGTRRTKDNSMPAAERIGEVLKSVKGTKATYTLSGDELYVRACVTSSRFHSNPSFKEQKVQAWTQPVGWKVEQTKKKEPAQGEK